MTGRLMTILVLTAVVWTVGCSTPPSQTALWQQVRDLQAAKNQLETKAERLEEENRQLLEQCSMLSSLNPALRLSALDRLMQIRLAKGTALTDENRDGKVETLRVHLEPVDQAGDVVKAPGQVHVSLWHLDVSAGEHLLGLWTVGAEELKTKWGRSLMGAYYRLMWNVEAILPEKACELTVKVEFTDYLTGKVLRTQKPLRIR
ncbi:MAG TPA: hypothetical protein PKY88_00920 [Anaerohalosphaeraceae bacterium]|nr:hypothetical protein [Anaerohalosphaeraceae bacterium]